MRITILTILFCFAAATLTAQEADSLGRKGKVYLDGSSSLENNLESARAGYFFTDRLLVGSGINLLDRPSLDNNIDVNISPFVRYYLASVDKKWRPYAEVGAEINLNEFDLNNVHAALGLERSLNQTTLLNLELRFDNYQRNGNGFQLDGSLNTILGGKAWKEAAQDHFRKGNLVVDNQLFNIGFRGSEFFDLGAFELSPSIGYFTSDRLMLQASLNLAFSDFEAENFNEEIASTAFRSQIRAGARYYLTTGKTFNFFAEGGLSYDHIYQKSTRSGVTSSNTQGWLRADLGLGTSIFINENTSIDFSVKSNKSLLDSGSLFFDLNVGMNFWF